MEKATIEGSWLFLIKTAGAELDQRIVSRAQAEGLGVLQADLPAAF